VGFAAKTKGLVRIMLPTHVAIVTMLAQEDRSSWLAGALAAAGIALMTVTMLRGIMRRRKRAARTEEMPRSTRIAKAIEAQQTEAASKNTTSPNTSHASQRVSLDRLMVEVEELTRVCAAQLENRATKLELLIAQADDRLAKLADASTQHLPSVAPSPPAVVTQRTASVQPVQSTTPAPIPTVSQAPSPASTSATDIRSRIQSLAHEGRSAAEISRALNEPVGKVELILALHNAARAHTA
jgi:hypothetical protein